MDTRSATQDPTLYLLHSALLLAVGSDRDYHGSSSSTPLPKLGAAQGRKFLQGVLDQTTDGEEASQSRNKRRRLAGVRAHPPTRRSLWPEANGEKASSSIAATPTPIRTALEHLPSYWRQHNALCEGCGGIVLPGVTATYAGRRQKQRRLDGKEGSRVGASCLVCRQEANEQGEMQGKRDDCSPISWLAEDVEAMKRRKGRFASVRSRKRTKGQDALPQPPPTPSRTVRPAKIDSTATKSESASKAGPSATSASASSTVKEKASRLQLESKPSPSAGPSRPAPGPAAAAVPPSPPRATKKSTLPPAASALTSTMKPKPQPQLSPATVPPSDRKARPPAPARDSTTSTNSNARRDKLASTDVDQEKQRKHDHKVALRAMLSGAGGGGGSGSGSRKKKDKGGEGGGGQQGKGAGGGSSSGGGGGVGGGLADFLAGL